MKTIKINVLVLVSIFFITVETSTALTTIVTSADGTSVTKYQRSGPNRSDPIIKIIRIDKTDPTYEVERVTDIIYDAQGRITENLLGGCSSCSGDSSNRIVRYDSEGRVIANLAKDENDNEIVLSSFSYDENGELIARWLGPIEDLNPIQQINRTKEKTYTITDTLNFVDRDNYSLSREITDTTGRVWEEISYEDMNVDPDAPFSKFYRKLHRYGPVTPSDPDLQAYWTFDDESGGLALDSSKLKRTGLLKGFIDQSHWTTGVDGQGCIEFNSTGEYMQINDYKGITGKRSRTVCFWAKTSSNGPIINWGDGTVGQDWAISITSGKPTLSILSSSCSSNVTVTDGDWHHIAVVLSNNGSPLVNEIRIYVDGDNTQTALVSGTLPIMTTSGQDVTIGKKNTTYFTGRLDNLLIIDRDLSASEIEVLYNSQLAANEDVRLHMVIEPDADPSGNGARTESIVTFKTVTNGGRYLWKQQDIQYGSDGQNGIETSMHEYAPINNGEDTRIIKSYSHGELTTEYFYNDLTSTQVQNQIGAAVTPVTKDGQSQDDLQLGQYFDYDAQGRIEHQYQYDYTAHPSFVPSYTDPGGVYNGTTYLNGSHYVYDGLGNLVKQYSTDGQYPDVEVQVEESKYNAFKEVYMTKSATGVVSGRIYDDTGSLKSEFVFSNPSVFSSISSYGQLLYECGEALDGNGDPEVQIANRHEIVSITYYTYDNSQRLDFINKAKSNDVFKYHKPGETVTGVDWVKTDYTYDTFGRRIQVREDAGVSRQTDLDTFYEFNNQGQVKKTILANKKFTKSVKNGRGQVKEQITGYMLGEVENVVSVVGYKYDEAGRLKEQIFPDGTRIQNEYDGFGRLKRVYNGVVPK